MELSVKCLCRDSRTQCKQCKESSLEFCLKSDILRIAVDQLPSVAICLLALSASVVRVTYDPWVEHNYCLCCVAECVHC